MTTEDPFLDLVRAAPERLPDPGPRDRAEATYLVVEITGHRPERVRFAIAIFDSVDAPGTRRACALLETQSTETRVVGPARLTPDMVAAPLVALAEVRLIPGPRVNARDGLRFRVHLLTGDRDTTLSFGDPYTRDPALARLGRTLNDYATWLANALPTAR